jgi:hypothetical protein
MKNALQLKRYYDWALCEPTFLGEDSIYLFSSFFPLLAPTVEAGPTELIILPFCDTCALSIRRFVAHSCYIYSPLLYWFLSFGFMDMGRFIGSGIPTIYVASWRLYTSSLFTTLLF